MERSLWLNLIKTSILEITAEDNPNDIVHFIEHFSNWSEDLINSPERASDNRSWIRELAVKYGGSGTPRRVYSWIATGIFNEYFESLPEVITHETLREHKERLLRVANILVDEKFQWDTKHDDEKYTILNIIEKKLEQFEKTLEVSGRKVKKKSLESVRASIVGRSPFLIRALRRAVRAAPYNINVLVLGETGVGKELVAALVHQMSARYDKPFIAVNCAAISPHLLESELFGHKKGAFTGALIAKRGLVELAHTGTLFLDEVGDLLPEHQSKLLRFLQDGVFRRVGGLTDRTVDVRFIAATNRDLEIMMLRDQFRADLYYRLHHFSVRIPPLRDRSDDIPELCAHFLDEFAQLESTPERPLTTPTVSSRLLRKLKRYHWPGNVRELKSVMYEAAVLREEDIIEDSDVSERIFGLEKRVIPDESTHLSQYMNTIIQKEGIDPGALDILSLADSIQPLYTKLKKKVFFEVFLRFLLQTGGLSFQFKDVVELFGKRGIGTRQSRTKFAQQAVKAPGVIIDNLGKTRQRRLRVNPQCLKYPYKSVISGLEVYFTRSDLLPEGRFLFEDFVLEYADTSFSNLDLKNFLGFRYWLRVKEHPLVIPDVETPDKYRIDLQWPRTPQTEKEESAGSKKSRKE